MKQVRVFAILAIGCVFFVNNVFAFEKSEALTCVPDVTICQEFIGDLLLTGIPNEPDIEQKMREGIVYYEDDTIRTENNSIIKVERNWIEVQGNARLVCGEPQQIWIDRSLCNYCQDTIYIQQGEAFDPNNDDRITHHRVTHIKLINGEMYDVLPSHVVKSGEQIWIRYENHLGQIVTLCDPIAIEINQECNTLVECPDITIRPDCKGVAIFDLHEHINTSLYCELGYKLLESNSEVLSPDQVSEIGYPMSAWLEAIMADGRKTTCDFEIHLAGTDSCEDPAVHLLREYEVDLNCASNKVVDPTDLILKNENFNCEDEIVIETRKSEDGEWKQGLVIEQGDTEVYVRLRCGDISDSGRVQVIIKHRQCFDAPICKDITVKLKNGTVEVPADSLIANLEATNQCNQYGVKVDESGVYKKVASFDKPGTYRYWTNHADTCVIGTVIKDDCDKTITVEQEDGFQTIDPVKKPLNVRLYPNPSVSGIIRIKTNNDTQASTSTYVYTLAGYLVCKGNNILDMSGNDPGVYIVKTVSQDNKIIIEKLILIE